ncbi:MAG: FtsW/RodA/SpoVE family cell cycle protein [Coxiella endosymbiont of Dermacentor nuttalli]
MITWNSITSSIFTSPCDDFIFAVSGEELGFIGYLILLIIF